MRTLGIDLAAQPAATGVCLVDWTTEPPGVDFPAAGASDRELLRWLGEVDKAGVDVPLGWPRAFVEAVSSHDAHRPLPRPTETTEDRAALCYRRTDLVVRTHPRVTRPPLSVSTDRIGIPALRMAGLEDACGRHGVPVDRSGVEGVVCEVYPAASLAIWGQPSSGYKDAGRGVAVRRHIAEGLTEALGLTVRALEPGIEDDDLLDAFVSALVARAAAQGHTTAPGDDDRDVAATEGWIHLPTVPPRALLGGAVPDGEEGA